MLLSPGAQPCMSTPGRALRKHPLQVYTVNAVLRLQSPGIKSLNGRNSSPPSRSTPQRVYGAESTRIRLKPCARNSTMVRFHESHATDCKPANRYVARLRSAPWVTAKSSGCRVGIMILGLCYYILHATSNSRYGRLGSSCVQSVLQSRGIAS